MQASCRLTLKCSYGVLDIPVCEKAFPDRITYTTRKAFNVNGNPGGIHECPEWGRNAESFALFDLMRGKEVSMENDDRRWLLPKSGGHGQVDLCQHQITDVVNHHRALVRYDGHPSTPKRPKNEIFKTAPGPLPKAIDSPILPNPIAAPGVVVLELFRIPGFHGLPSREISPLGNCELEQSSPGVLNISLGHNCEKVT
jgi:hypothetical protein